MTAMEKTTQIKGKKIGYVRVSDNEQNEDLQIDALKHAGCTVVYGDHGVSGNPPGALQHLACYLV